MIRIGPHMLTCACVTAPEVDHALNGLTARVLYTDPPWNDGMLRFFATLNKRATGQEVKPISFESMLARLTEIVARYVSGHVFVESSIAEEPRVIAALARELRHIRTVRLRYQSGSRWRMNTLIYGVTAGIEPIDLKTIGIDGQGGPGIAERCVRATAAGGSLVIDPFCGMGYTARAALAAGARFYGNELNPARLRKTTELLAATAEVTNGIPT